jgi:MoaA/NifB/PqqE/SkfB family radical SAM enzyme
MKDSLNKLYLEITTHCNLDCQSCIRQVWDEVLDHMPLALVSDLLRQLADFPVPPIIHLGGYGEPMAHPNFLEIVRLAKATEALVEVTTNGTLLTREVAAALLDLELDRLVVSIDGTTPKSYDQIRVNGDLHQVMENVRHLYQLKLRHNGRQGRPQIGIAFVALKSNVADLPGLRQLASRIGAGRIQVTNLVPHTPEMEQEILYQQALTACAFRGSPWIVDMSLPKLDLNAKTLLPLQQVYASSMSLSLLGISLSDRNDYCRFTQEGYAAIRRDGQVSPCLSLLHDHPEYVHGRRKDVTHYSLGDIGQDSLFTIWESPEYVEFRTRLRDFPYSPCTTCGGCERFPRNYGDCCENQFPTCGGCLWAQGFIDCP